MNAKSPRIAHDVLTDAALDSVSGGEKHQVTLEEYERILARMIAQRAASSSKK
ncbi:MAG: hypothetical protein PS018_24345 [bacterium]|nr:hypothetical protein [bacterium]